MNLELKTLGLLNRSSVLLLLKNPIVQSFHKPTKYVHLVSHTGQHDVAIPNTSNDNDEEVGQKKGQVRRKMDSNNFFFLFMCLKTHCHLLLMIKALNLFVSSSLIFLMPLTLKVINFIQILREAFNNKTKYFRLRRSY